MRALILATIAALSIRGARAPMTCQRIGDFTYCDNGTTSQQIGDFTLHPTRHPGNRRKVCQRIGEPLHCN